MKTTFVTAQTAYQANAVAAVPSQNPTQVNYFQMSEREKDFRSKVTDALPPDFLAEHPELVRELRHTMNVYLNDGVFDSSPDGKEAFFSGAYEGENYKMARFDRCQITSCPENGSLQVMFFSQPYSQTPEDDRLAGASLYAKEGNILVDLLNTTDSLTVFDVQNCVSASRHSPAIQNPETYPKNWEAEDFFTYLKLGLKNKETPISKIHLAKNLGMDLIRYYTKFNPSMKESIDITKLTIKKFLHMLKQYSSEVFDIKLDNILIKGAEINIIDFKTPTVTYRYYPKHLAKQLKTQRACSHSHADYEAFIKKTKVLRYIEILTSCIVLLDDEDGSIQTMPLAKQAQFIEQIKEFVKEIIQLEPELAQFDELSTLEHFESAQRLILNSRAYI